MRKCVCGVRGGGVGGDGGGVCGVGGSGVGGGGGGGACGANRGRSTLAKATTPPHAVLV